MDRTMIQDFQARLNEARDILEAANEQEIARLEAAKAATDRMMAQLRMRHSELLTYIDEWKQELVRSVNDTMSGVIEFQMQRFQEYEERLAALRDIPPPRLIISA